MTKHWHVDFETYSGADLKSAGMFRYAEDPSTEGLVLAFSDGEQDPIGVDLTLPDYKDRLGPLFSGVSKGHTLVAHNAQFEWLIWELLVSRGVFPFSPKPSQWSCTAARARMLALPGSLKGAANALGVGVNKDDEGQALIQLFSKPGKTGRTFPRDNPEAFKRFIDYCRQDVRVEMRLHKILPELPEVEKQAFILDFKINKKGMPVNLELVNKADLFVQEYSEILLKKAVQIAGCSPTQREKTISFLASRGFEVPDLQAPTVEKLLERPDLPPDLEELLDSRIELSRAGTKKLKAIQNSISTDGRIRGGFLFSAASTRRWSSVGVQMHNLQKPSGETNPEVVMEILGSDPWALVDVFERPLTALAQSIRAFFESESNFLVADYSSVEPRGLAWMVGETWMLEAYRNKQDAYKLAASKVYGIPPSEVGSSQRFTGKQLVLGCNYAMGPQRFIETCAKFGRTLTLEEAKEAVGGYRKSVPKIVESWRSTEKSCIRAIKSWKTITNGRLTFRPALLSNGFPVLFVDMPSGTICYPKPSIGSEEWNGERRDTFEFYTPLGSSWVKTNTHGGSLVENWTQALTRDILRDGLLSADKAGFELVGHCHDEALAEGSEKDLQEFERLLCSSDWAEGFPIETEGYVSKRYKK